MKTHSRACASEIASVPTIAPEKNCRPVRFRAWVRVRIRVGMQFPSDVIVTVC